MIINPFVDKSIDGTKNSIHRKGYDMLESRTISRITNFSSMDEFLSIPWIQRLSQDTRFNGFSVSDSTPPMLFYEINYNLPGDDCVHPYEYREIGSFQNLNYIDWPVIKHIARFSSERLRPFTKTDVDIASCLVDAILPFGLKHEDIHRDYKIKNPLGPNDFSCDFAIPKIKLNVEVDYGTYINPDSITGEYFTARDAVLKGQGWEVIRFHPGREMLRKFSYRTNACINARKHMI